jgi:biopolymer transport protein ExbB
MKTFAMRVLSLRAKRSNLAFLQRITGDCHVATLLAMTSRQFLEVPLIVTLCFVSAASASKKEDHEFKEEQARLESLKADVEAARDSLENEVARRYGLKQKLVDRREQDKQEMDQLRDGQERAANDLARVKEECLAREQTVTDERKAAQSAREEWSNEKSALSEVFKKEADAVLEAFPIDRETRRQALEKVRADFASKQDPTQAWDDFVAYACKDFQAGANVSMVACDVLPDQGGPVHLTLVRFGNVFGLGIDKTGQAYLIRQTGRLGADKYAVEKIGSPSYAAYVSAQFGPWLKIGKPDGLVKTEILQNDQSRLLVSGKKVSFWAGLYASLKAGGLIMIPLLFLPLWVLYLTFWKGFQLLARGRSYRRCHKAAIALIDKGDIDGALTFAKSEKGVMARVLEICLERKEHGRHVSERAVREQIVQEVPIISRGINTIAVIAGAAPLMGLLGTISGMITLFAAVTHYGTGDPKFLAGGISEALITAKTGLAIAIPTLFIHDLIRNGKDRLLAEIEQLSISVMTHIWPEE